MLSLRKRASACEKEPQPAKKSLSLRKRASACEKEPQPAKKNFLPVG